MQSCGISLRNMPTGLLFPLDPVKRAIVDQWTDWTATTFQPAWIGVFWMFYRTRPENRDEARIKAALKDSRAALAILDARLATLPFLGGADLTYADIVAGTALNRWYTMESKLGSSPMSLPGIGDLRSGQPAAGA